MGYDDDEGLGYSLLDYLFTDDEENDTSDEALQAQLARESKSELSHQLARDESDYANRRRRKLSKEWARLARSSERIALERLEVASRTEEDFDTVLSIWDRMDENRERRERYREVLRGNEIPLEYGATNDGATFPRFLMNPALRQLCHGFFWDVLFDCPFEMHDLLADVFLSKRVEQLKDEHKEVLYFLAVRLYKPSQLAAMRGQTDRNIRKVRDTIDRKLRNALYQHLSRREPKRLTGRERTFLECYRSEFLDSRDDTE